LNINLFIEGKHTMEETKTNDPLSFLINTFNLIYGGLRWFFAPAVPYLFPRRKLPLWMTRGRHVEVITANQITVFRTAMVIPISMLVYHHHYKTAFITFVIAAVLDFVDGLVATVHRRLGFQDSSDLGKFLDAFCDKIFYILTLSLVLLSSRYETMGQWAIAALVIVSLLSMGCEVWLAVVRVEDYYYNKLNGASGARELKAKGAGKLKFALEMVGVGGLYLSLPSSNHWSFYVGFACLICSFPFAVASLKQKLQQR
jgi:phosphatidylglycerophosphate synthase